MTHKQNFNFDKFMKHRQTRWTITVFIGLLIISLAVFSAQSTTAAPTADCGNGNFYGTYETEDITLSGDLFVTDDVLIRNDVTVTISAESSVTFCGEYQIRVEGGGNLIAIGTPTESIPFSADDPLVKWDAIQFMADHGEHSMLQYVELNDGGAFIDGNTPNAPIYIYSWVTELPSPVVDHVTINNSGDYGLYLLLDSDDLTPPSFTNIAIDNSANAAVLADAEALGGFGGGNTYTGNNPNTIQIHGGGGSRLYYSQTWRNPGIPVEVLDDMTVAAQDSESPAPTLTIEPGMTFLLYPQTDVFIGISLGRGGNLVAKGTADAPITFTRADDLSAPWRSLRLELYSDTSVKLSYVDFSFGGNGVDGMIHQLGNGALMLDHVSVANSAFTGLYSRGGVLNVQESLFEGNDIGLEIWFETQAILRNSMIRNNVTAGLESVDSGFDNNCIDAAGNFWGSPDGPQDGYAAEDACGNGSTNSGFGDSVSGGVRYAPWLPGDGELQDRGVLKPEKFYVLANGVETSNIQITLRDAQGNPLVGKQVSLEASVGSVQQPTSLTDVNGMTTAVISSTQPGYAYLSAYNFTDDTPISGLGGITFWTGDGNGSGLVDPSGIPYNYPELIIEGKPFQQGFPIGFRVPMQNSTAEAIDVQVVYGVSALNIGARFTPVYTASLTLQPGDTWNAQGSWYPNVSGHHCIQAAITTNGGAEMLVTGAVNDTIFTRQQNTDINPCDKAIRHVNKLVPSPSKGPQAVFSVGVHFLKLLWMTMNISDCLNETLEFRAPNTPFDVRDYEVLVEPPQLTPPVIEDPDLNQAQLEALNSLAQTAADIYAVKWAMNQTSLRLFYASISLAYNAPKYQRLQYDAYRTLDMAYADKLYEMAAGIDQLLAATEGAGVGDGYYDPADFSPFYTKLEANGFDTETTAFYDGVGFAESAIDELEEDIVAQSQAIQPTFIGFYDHLHEYRDEVLAIADKINAQYGQTLQRSMASETHQFRPQVYTFVVGNPTESAATVELVVLPVNIPVNWTYSLESHSFDLQPGETVETTFTLYPNSSTLDGDLVEVAVEGYIANQLIGGILFQHETPKDAISQQIFLPITIR